MGKNPPLMYAAVTHILPHFEMFCNGFGFVFGSLEGCTKRAGGFWAKWRLTGENAAWYNVATISYIIQYRRIRYEKAKALWLVLALAIMLEVFSVVPVTAANGMMESSFSGQLDETEHVEFERYIRKQVIWKKTVMTVAEVQRVTCVILENHCVVAL